MPHVLPSFLPTFLSFSYLHCSLHLFLRSSLTYSSSSSTHLHLLPSYPPFLLLLISFYLGVLTFPQHRAQNKTLTLSACFVEAFCLPFFVPSILLPLIYFSVLSTSLCSPSLSFSLFLSSVFPIKVFYHFFLFVFLPFSPLLSGRLFLSLSSVNSEFSRVCSRTSFLTSSLTTNRLAIVLSVPFFVFLLRFPLLVFYFSLPRPWFDPASPTKQNTARFIMF